MARAKQRGRRLTAEQARHELARRLADVIGDAPYLYDGLPGAG